MAPDPKATAGNHASRRQRDADDGGLRLTVRQDLRTQLLVLLKGDVDSAHTATFSHRRSKAQSR